MPQVQILRTLLRSEPHVEVGWHLIEVCAEVGALVLNAAAQVSTAAVLHYDVEMIILPSRSSSHLRKTAKGPLVRSGGRGAEGLGCLEEGLVVRDHAHVLRLCHDVAFVEGVHLPRIRRVRKSR